MGRNPRFAMLVLALSSLIAVSCGGGGSGKTTAVPTQTSPAAATATPGTPEPSTALETLIPTQTPRPTRTPTGSAGDEAAIGLLIDRGLAALQAHDATAFRALFPSGTAPSDSELEVLYTCMATATRTQEAPTITFLSNLARATVRFNKTINGQTSVVEGNWEFQKLPGPLWAFYIAPFCPQ